MKSEILSPIKVSIQCLVYNHEDYLRKCLDGFVMQKTNFRFEAIVHDDASTDGSAAIIREYAEKYPDIIKPIYQTQNQFYIKGAIRKAINSAIDINSKYYALCEGDDYWIDPVKLQKQVDYMESHPECSVCTTAANLIEADSDKNIGVVTTSSSIKTFGMRDAIKGYGHIASTPSFLFKKEILTNVLPLFYRIAPCGDYTIPIIGCTYGSIVNLPDITCSHRVLAKGSMTKSWSEDFAKRTEYNQKYERMLDEIDIFTEHKYHKEVERERVGVWFRSYLAAGKYPEIRNWNSIKYMLSEPGITKFKLLAKVYFSPIYKILQNIKHGQ